MLPLMDDREKSRYILELRYPAVVQMFDKRGEVLNKVFPLFQDKTSIWRVDNAQVIMMDDLEAARKQFSVDHLRCSVVYEDPTTFQEFLADSDKYISELQSIFPAPFKKLNRIGFRTITIFNCPQMKSYEDIFSAVKACFLSSRLPLSVPPVDFRVTLISDACTISVGPCKKGEEWIKAAFTRPGERIPERGIALDVDSYAQEVSCEHEGDVLNRIHAVQDLTFLAEQEIVTGIRAESIRVPEKAAK